MQQNNRNNQNRRFNILSRRTSNDRQSLISLQDSQADYFIKGKQMGPQTHTLEYKDYQYPWDAKKKNTLKQCICAFLNTEGGIILIGVTETSNLKRIVNGKKYSEQQKQQLKKDVTLIVEKISRMVIVNRLVKVQFIPVYNITQQARNIHYVVKITIQKGWLKDSRNLYSLNGNYYFRTENEVKYYNDEVDLQQIIYWRLALEEQKEKEIKRLQQIEAYRNNRRFQRYIPKVYELQQMGTQTIQSVQKVQLNQSQTFMQQNEKLTLAILPNQAKNNQVKNTWLMLSLLVKLWQKIKSCFE